MITCLSDAGTSIVLLGPKYTITLSACSVLNGIAIDFSKSESFTETLN